MARSLAILMGCVTLPGVVCQDSTIVELAQATNDLSTLVDALTAADLVDTLSGEGPFTVFAPTNAAFAAIEETVTELLKAENKADLVNVLTYHVVSGKSMAADLSDGTDLATVMAGGKLSVAMAGDTVTIGGVANVTQADVEASNGVVHIINVVLVPPNIVQLAQATNDLSTLVEALIAADLVDTLSGPGPFTVFAPTNAAFAAIEETVTELLKAENKADLVNVLTYHVVSGKSMAADLSDGTDLATVMAGGKLSVAIAGDTVTIGGVAKVATPDVKAFNGVVHIIDAVLVPPPSTTSDTVSTSVNANSSKVSTASEQTCVCVLALTFVACVGHVL